MGWQRAENVIALLHDSSFEGEITLMDVVDAVGTYGNLDKCIQYLQQECPICFRKFPHREVTNINWKLSFNLSFKIILLCFSGVEIFIIYLYLVIYFSEFNQKTTILTFFPGMPI